MVKLSGRRFVSDVCVESKGVIKKIKVGLPSSVCHQVIYPDSSKATFKIFDIPLFPLFLKELNVNVDIECDEDCIFTINGREPTDEEFNASYELYYCYGKRCSTIHTGNNNGCHMFSYDDPPEVPILPYVKQLIRHYEYPENAENMEFEELIKQVKITTTSKDICY